MKRSLIAIIILILAISLCACGRIDGAEAAALYPDIIGQWGTDYFGEEFVLSLQADGSCVVLDNPGTWKLDTKQSDNHHVILNIQTEQAKYFVDLGRHLPEPNESETVHLLIMDQKQETTVYTGPVFSAVDLFVSPEEALYTVPELIGEWGSEYWKKESTLTIREDGTCTLLRQQGRWGLHRNASTWPWIQILIKLDSGEQYFCDFYMHDELPDPILANMEIFNIETRIGIESNIDIYVINRAVAPVAMEIAAEAIGTWAIPGEEGNPVVTFNEDGTCNIRGADGIWTIPYVTLYEDYFELSAQINDTRYTIYFNTYDDGRHDITIYNDDNMAIVPHNTEIIKIAEN